MLPARREREDWLDEKIILERVISLLASERPLTGEVVLVTAGPTQEPIDPVRFISNRSSGKMGYALARAAKESGARVILISGPTQMTSPSGVERIVVRTAEEMKKAVEAHYQRSHGRPNGGRRQRLPA
ncbi:MAG: phosphopantothenoylcysteine decarboxylase [Candidatus Manganitrophus sp.]|nr:phosphopantothenoylcysteine decarboxylase [Candidatus Manganitrophus sp.]